jgi:ATP synthase subunit 6
MMTYFSPLEPFRVEVIIPFLATVKLDSVVFCPLVQCLNRHLTMFTDYSLNITAVFSILTLSLILIYVDVVLKRAPLRIGSDLNFVEKLIAMVINLIFTNFGPKHFNKIFFIICFVFLFIFFMNSISMVPFTFAVTSQFVVTFTIAGALFFGLTLTGLLENGVKFFTLFVPQGAPAVLTVFLVIIEFISYVARVFSLAIRLFANILAGHALVGILGNFALLMLMFLGAGLTTFWLPLLIVFCVCALEVMIAGLQAYVFVMLLTLYYHDAIYLH